MWMVWSDGLNIIPAAGELQPLLWQCAGRMPRTSKRNEKGGSQSLPPFSRSFSVTARSPAHSRRSPERSDQE